MFRLISCGATALAFLIAPIEPGGQTALMPFGSTVAMADESNGGGSGEHQGGQGSGSGQHQGGGGQHQGGGGQGQGQGGKGKGPNPNCPYQDHSGRGGYGPGGGKHSTGEGGDVKQSATAGESQGGVTGGGAGGESFICDSPGRWHTGTKVFPR